MKLFLSTAVLFSLCASGSTNPVLISPVEPELDSKLPAEISISCPPGYSQPANSNWDKCYKVYTNFKSRKDASTQCKKDNGTLSSIPNAFVNSYLYSLASQSTASSIWLGVQCFSNDPASCVNDDGSPFSYNNFNSGQPTTNDVCVYISTIGRDSQKWSTFDCEQNFQFSCEVNSNVIQSVTTTTVLPTTTQISHKSCPTDYHQFNGTCYKVNDFLFTMPTDCPYGYYVEIGLKCPNITYAGDASSCVWDDGTPFGYNGFKSVIQSVTTTTVLPTTTQISHKSCPTDYHQFNGTCYKIIYRPYVNYEQTKELCQEIPGGNIVSIPTKEVNDFLFTMPTDCPYGYYVEIGLKCPNITYAGDASSCVWDDGTPFGYNGFKSGEPSTTSSCVEMELGLWNSDFQCDQFQSCGACQAPMS